jgi:hypothetical protein
MTRTGLDDAEPEDREPEDLGAWVAAGFTAEDAEVWRRWRFMIAEATAWQAAGVLEGLHAAQWSTAGVTASSVESWRAAGIDAPEAVRWHEFGYDLEAARAEKQTGRGPLDAFANRTGLRPLAPGIGPVVGARQSFVGRGDAGSARQFLERGVDPRLMHGYLEHQWMDEDAVAWASRGVTADDAYVWFELGLTPAEAARLTSQGRGPTDVIREWWSAGIPFAEVADWLGAGLTASEAVQQRARGITAEHAAALRALRRADEPGRPTGSLSQQTTARQGPPNSEQVGPPPADEQAAIAGIAEACAAMFTPDTPSNSIPAVEDGDQLVDCLTQLATEFQRLGTSGIAATIGDVRFINDHQAQVPLLIRQDEISGPVFHDQAGRAVLVEGKWKVARDTFCELMQRMGIECPPRPTAS